LPGWPLNGHETVANRLEIRYLSDRSAWLHVFNLAKEAALTQTIPHFGYDRKDLRPHLAHIGVGNFHRSHQACHLDRLLGAGATDWAYWGIGLLPRDSAMRDALAAQDFAYTLLQNLPTGERAAHQVRSIVGMDLAAEDPGQVMARLTDPETRIVSLTVTEGGYNISDSTGEFDAANPAVLADLDPSQAPRTLFRFLAEALRRRRELGVDPFTVMSCDNLPGNGQVARRAVTAFADLFDPGLGGWIGGHVAFPNSMVDRITPVTTDADRAWVQAAFGVADRWPVPCEPFAQWVLEDDFPTGRPPFEQAGVQLTGDVVPYENMKLRLLNGAHQAIGHFGLLLGDDLVDVTARRPAVIAFLRRYFSQASATLGDVPGVDLAGYTATLLERFANPYVKDTNARLVTDASDRVPKFVLATAHAALAAGADASTQAAVVAAWARRAELAASAGDLDDRAAAQLFQAVRCGDGLAFLDPARFGALADDPAFTGPYLATLQSLRQRGPEATLAALAAAGAGDGPSAHMSNNRSPHCADAGACLA
jgi:mannitol 2-dehydrogenase